MTLTNLFSDIANAIRAKTGGTAPIIAADFPAAIAGISGGGIPDGIQPIKVNVTCNNEGTYHIHAPIIDGNGTLQDTCRQLYNGDTFYTCVSKSQMENVHVVFYFIPNDMLSVVDSFEATVDDGEGGAKVGFAQTGMNGIEEIFGYLYVSDDFASDKYEITLNMVGRISGGW